MKKKNLSILIITATYPPESSGGVAAHVHYLAKSLNDLRTSGRHFVNIVTVHNKGQSRPEKFGTPPNIFIHKLQGVCSHFDPIGAIPFEKAVKYCMELCNDPIKKPDVIHVHDFEGVHIATLLKAVFQIPIIFTVHKTPKEWDNTHIYRDTKNFHLQALTKLKLFDYFIAPSAAYKQHLLDHGIVNRKIEIIHHGIPKHYLESLNDKKVFQRIKFNPVGKKLIFCPIRLDKHKGPDIFIEAASIVLETLQDETLYFIIAGNGSDKYKRQMTQFATSCGVVDKILIGPPDNLPLTLAEMASVYRQSHICVLPSRREGFGQVVLEAFLFKKPIIGSNVGGISELIIPGGNGLLFNRDEADDLAEQIIRLLEDKKLSTTIAENGRKDFLEKYDAKFMAGKYYDLYMKCAEEGYRREKKGRPRKA